MFHATWKDFKTRFNGILRALREHKALIERQAAFLLSRSSLDDFKQHQQDKLELFEYARRNDKFLDDIRAEIDKKERELRQRQCDDAQRWFDATSPTQEHERACNLRLEYPESGRWIFNKSKIQNWKAAETPDFSMLWLNGIPGAGTFSASHIRWKATTCQC